MTTTDNPTYRQVCAHRGEREYGCVMPSNAPLLIDLTGVARLADVQRPVASMWRARFATSADPFPQSVTTSGGRPLFDATAVAHWLARTAHGNNPDAVADAAAAATPLDFDIADASHLAAVDALLALRAASGEPVGDAPAAEREQRATAVDPGHTCLLPELAAISPEWARWADLLADAAYSPLQASRLLEQRHAATAASAGSTGPLALEAQALLTSLAAALVGEHTTELVLHSGISPALAGELLSHTGDQVELVVPPSEGRGIRRRLLCDGMPLPAPRPSATAARLYVMRAPTSTLTTTSAILRSVNELALTMHDRDRALIIAPAAALTDSLGPADDLERTDILRSGRIRAVAKLPAGLVTSAPREALAIWVLGRETGDVPIADRFTAIADLTEAPLTEATRADLTSDVLAAMGSAFDVRAHAFRFTRLARTSSLLASRGALVIGSAPRATTPSTRDLPARIDQARALLGSDAPGVAPTAAPGPTLPAADLETLIAERHVRMLPGTRVSADAYADSGLAVVGADDLAHPARIGSRRVDPLLFAARHPSARLTMPGDVVFRTAPTPEAWVDPDGSKVVAHPARVLRIDPADPGGLVPELVAADIARSPGGPGSWRRWRLRRVAPHVSTRLREALAGIAAHRERVTRQLAALDSYAELLTAGVVAGTVTLTDHAAAAASDSQ